jgi:hypothetical protein
LLFTRGLWMSRPAWLAPALLTAGSVPVAMAIYACAAGSPSGWFSLVPFSFALGAVGLAARSAWRSPTAVTQALALSLLLALYPVVALLWPDSLGRAGVSLAVVGVPLAAALGLASAWHFPTARTIPPFWSAAIVGLTLGAAALGGLGWATGGDSPVFLAVPVGLAVVFSVVAALVLLYTAARAERASARMSARWALLGLGLAALLALAAGLWGFLDLHAAGAPAGTLLALSLVPLGWAGQQALGGLHPRDLPQAARRALAMFLGTVVVASAAALLAWAAGGPPGSWVTMGGVACGAAFAAAALRGHIESLLRRRSSREIVRLREIAQEVARLVRKPTGREALEKAVDELRGACAANRITLLLPAGERIEKSAEGLPPGPRRAWSEAIASALQSAGGPIFADDPAGETAFAKIREATGDREVAGYVPLLFGQDLRGILVFSHKEWGRRYDIEEIDLLGVAGYALARLLSTCEKRAPVQPAREEERAKPSEERLASPALPGKLDPSRPPLVLEPPSPEPPFSERPVPEPPLSSEPPSPEPPPALEPPPAPEPMFPEPASPELALSAEPASPELPSPEPPSPQLALSPQPASPEWALSAEPASLEWALSAEPASLEVPSPEPPLPSSRPLASARLLPPFLPPVVFAESEAMRRTLEELGARASQGQPILLCGERGSGRELLARHVHATTRPERPFARWNACGLPDLRASRTLGALAAQARGGTLYIEPVEALGPLAQEALVGIIGEAEGPRVIASVTPPSLQSSPISGELRRALGNAVLVPPLRERIADIPLLAAHLLKQISDGYPPPLLSSEALEVLCAYGWPGNVPELRAVLERAAALSLGGVLSDRDLMLGPTPASDPYAGTFADIEHRALAEALRRAGGNKSLAARRLGLKRTTFLEKLKRAEERLSPRRLPSAKPADKG